MKTVAKLIQMARIRVIVGLFTSNVQYRYVRPSVSLSSIRSWVYRPSERESIVRPSVSLSSVRTWVYRPSDREFIVRPSVSLSSVRAWVRVCDHASVSACVHVTVHSTMYVCISHMCTFLLKKYSCYSFEHFNFYLNWRHYIILTKCVFIWGATVTEYKFI